MYSPAGTTAHWASKGLLQKPGKCQSWGWAPGNHAGGPQRLSCHNGDLWRLDTDRSLSEVLSICKCSKIYEDDYQPRKWHKACQSQKWPGLVSCLYQSTPGRLQGAMTATFRDTGLRERDTPRAHFTLLGWSELRTKPHTTRVPQAWLSSLCYKHRCIITMKMHWSNGNGLPHIPGTNSEATLYTRRPASSSLTLPPPMRAIFKCLQF